MSMTYAATTPLPHCCLYTVCDVSGLSLSLSVTFWASDSHRLVASEFRVRSFTCSVLWNHVWNNGSPHPTLYLISMCRHLCAHPLYTSSSPKEWEPQRTLNLEARPEISCCHHTSARGDGRSDLKNADAMATLHHVCSVSMAIGKEQDGGRRWASEDSLPERN